MARLSDYDCIGFDLDHTLIQYKLDNLYPLIYSCFTQVLVKERGYDPSLLEDDFDDLKDFCLRGLVLDAKKGNILKLGKDGFILRATHGTRQMSNEEITDCYGEKHMWTDFSSLEENPIQHSSIFRVFENYFDLPLVVICARIVDVIDEKNGKPEEYNFWPDILSSLRQIFNPSSFGAQQGYYFSSVKQNTSKFVKPCSKKIIEWIKSLKEGKQTVFLLTNSFIDYTNLLMNYAVGKDWSKMFDIIVCMAGKPGFFKTDEPLPKFHQLEGEKEVCTVQELKENNIYSRGNHRDFTSFLQKQTNQDNPKVLFFGDSIRSDLYPSAVFGGWHVITVLEEMESEGMVTCENECSVEDGPRSKKARLAMHEIEIEKNKEEVLLSNQWGSFFVHHKANKNGVINNTCTVEGNHICEKKPARSEMNTYWGDLIQKYSTLAIPRIDFITELPLDYTFEPFSASTGGFFPGSPKSLHW